MLVKDIIELACIFTNKQDLLETSTFDTSSQTSATSDQQKEIDMLVRCLNLVVGEVCCDYIPLVEQEQIEVENGKFNFSSLSKIAIEILNIYDENNCKIKCKISPSSVNLKNGKYTVEYSYVPGAMTLSGNMPSFYCRIPERVFAYGVAMEYSLLCSLYDEMDIWQTRFKDALQIAMQKHSEKRLPRRGWF